MGPGWNSGGRCEKPGELWGPWGVGCRDTRCWRCPASPWEQRLEPHVPSACSEAVEAPELWAVQPPGARAPGSLRPALPRGGSGPSSEGPVPPPGQPHTCQQAVPGSQRGLRACPSRQVPRTDGQRDVKQVGVYSSVWVPEGAGQPRAALWQQRLPGKLLTEAGPLQGTRRPQRWCRHSGAGALPWEQVPPQQPCTPTPASPRGGRPKAGGRQGRSCSHRSRLLTRDSAHRQEPGRSPGVRVGGSGLAGGWVGARPARQARASLCPFARGTPTLHPEATAGAASRPAGVPWRRERGGGGAKGAVAAAPLGPRPGGVLGGGPPRLPTCCGGQTPHGTQAEAALLGAVTLVVSGAFRPLHAGSGGRQGLPPGAAAGLQGRDWGGRGQPSRPCPRPPHG